MNPQFFQSRGGCIGSAILVRGLNQGRHLGIRRSDAADELEGPPQDIRSIFRESGI
jgi:hypothetical protein